MQELTTHIIVLAILFLTQERDNATIRDASGDNRHLIHVVDIWEESAAHRDSWFRLVVFSQGTVVRASARGVL
jgi:hypothetical protein